MLDLNLKTTTFTGKVNFLANQDAQYAAVTIDETYVAADGNGIKKLLAGAIIGKAGSLFRPYTAAVAAAYTIAGGAANSHVKFTAKTGGVAGNGIKVQIVQPAAQTAATSAKLDGDVVVITPKCGADPFAITATAAEVVAAVNAALGVNALVIASLPGVETGAAAVIELAATALEGGVDALGVPYAILAEDVDLTNYNVNTGASYSDKSAAAIVRGRVIEARLPVAPDAATKAALTGILWA